MKGLIKALSIAKILFEEEGYHIRYLEQIETIIKEAVMKKIGSLWKKHSKKAGDYFTGTLDLGAMGKVNIGLFKNEKKDPDSNEPDCNLVLFEETDNS